MMELVVFTLRVTYPKIKDVTGRMRQRCLLMKVTAEGSCDWKKINAMEDTIDWEIEFETGTSTFKAKQHTHIVKLTKFDIGKLKCKEFVQKVSEHEELHQHIISVIMSEDGEIMISDCNTGSSLDNVYCFDKHQPIPNEKKLLVHNVQVKMITLNKMHG